MLIVTASVGAGHDRPAREMAARIQQCGGRATVVDLVTLTPGGPALRALFRGLLTHRPQLWGRLHESCDQQTQVPPGLQWAATAAGRQLARIADRVAADLVISTFPLGGRVVGAARGFTERSLPLAVYVTDPAVHTLWVDEFADLFLVSWDFSALALGARTRTPVAWCAPAIGSAFDTSATRAADWPLPPVVRPLRRELALVCSGSWGVGDVLQTVHDLLRHTTFQPVVVCGRNAKLRGAVHRIPGATALGWVDDMAALMRTCDVAVLNSGGLTLAEAAAVGLPVIHHRPLIGQGQMNADACHRAADVPTSVRGEDLIGALTQAALMTPRLGVEDPVELAAGLQRQPAPRRADVREQLWRTGAA